jgi:NAD(P)-dependent dehydrogenase (short-subunit alcohol dehydrogenase family)
MSLPLSGRVALVTGAGSGIGAASARALAAGGAAVAVTDVDTAAAARVASHIAQAGGQAMAVGLDVVDADQWQHAVEVTAAEFGPITVLHSNAAPTADRVMRRDLDVVSLDPDVWDFVIAVVLRGTMLGCKYVIPPMVAAGGGSIIVTSSIKGRTGSTMRTAYATAKGGLEQLVRMIATGYGPHGVRCNAVAPGIIDTPGLRETADAGYMAALQSAHLVPRLGTTDEIADAVVYLASDSASFITAQTLVIDGGLSAYVPALSPPATPAGWSVS